MGIFQKWFKGRKKEPRRSQGGYPGTAFSGLAPEGPDFRPHAFLIPIQTRFDEVFRKHGEYWDHVRSRFLAGIRMYRTRCIRGCCWNSSVFWL
ncbi:hypothetical protein CM49_00381 [Paenibacillus sp. P1XP2]|nr:hypothetical protein CM49_00381 [Paenibacillus sp. P1XP2]